MDVASISYSDSLAGQKLAPRPDFGRLLKAIQSSEIFRSLLPRARLQGNDFVGPDNEEEDNRVTKKRRLDDDSGINDGGGIQEPERRAPGPSTVISRGTDGLEKAFQRDIMQRLSQKDVNLYNLEKILENFELKWKKQERRSDQLPAQITRNIYNVRIELLQMRKRNPEMSLKDLLVYVPPSCWSSAKRLEFYCRVSDAIFSITKIEPEKSRKELRELEQSREELRKLKELHSELESEWALIGAGSWTDKIGEWINSLDERYRPQGVATQSVEGLLRFVRNRWHHPDEFKISHKLCSAESLYKYFDDLFPDLLKVSYGVAYRCCGGQKWFKEL